MQELLSDFNGHLDSYREHRDYIARAQAQAEKFSSSVIEKVVLDHEVKASSVADQILPLVPEIEAHLDRIAAEEGGIHDTKSSADVQMEELQLRQLIGELTDDAFEAESAGLREQLDSANGRLEELGAEREQLQGALDSWIELATAAGQDSGTRDAAPEAAASDEDDAPEDPTPVVEDDSSGGEHSSTEYIQDDVSAVFSDDEDAAAETAVEDDADEAIEAGEDVDFGFEDEDAEGGEVELNLVDSAQDSAEEGAAEIGIDLDAVEAEAAEDEAEDGEGGEDDEARRALLLYQEGTAEEQIYPFTGEVLTIGRGRDNDIQIKNDSKVSRFHCKLFRRSGNFYIEDNKSSNGTLVNGELITERRLFGGEEVIIGETFFRFRIM